MLELDLELFLRACIRGCVSSNKCRGCISKYSSRELRVKQGFAEGGRVPRHVRRLSLSLSFVGRKFSHPPEFARDVSAARPFLPAGRAGLRH